MNTVSGYAITEKNSGVVAECEVSNRIVFLQKDFILLNMSYFCYNYTEIHFFFVSLCLCIAKIILLPQRD